MRPNVRAGDSYATYQVPNVGEIQAECKELNDLYVRSTTVGGYVSDRVFDGIRFVPPERVRRMKSLAIKVLDEAFVGLPRKGDHLKSLPKKMRLDSIDFRIIDILSSDAKVTIKAIASKIGLSDTPTWRRIKRLEKDGIIKGYRAELDVDLVAALRLVRDRSSGES